MQDDKVIDLRQPGDFADPLSEIIRRAPFLVDASGGGGSFGFP